MIGLTIRPLAEADLKQAYEWYELQNQGLGETFLHAVKITFLSIRNAPLQFQVKHAKVVRSAIITYFPYSIHFVLDKDKAIVLGILHHKRNPKIWKKRQF